MGPIFINDDGEFITASVKQVGRIKFFIHTAAAGARRQHCLRVQLTKSTGLNIKDDFHTCAGLRHLGRLLSRSRRLPASPPTSVAAPNSASTLRVRMQSKPKR